MARAFNVRGMLTVLLVAGLYLAAGYVGLPFSITHSAVSPVWPASGVALAALLVLGGGYWPGIFLGTLTFTVLRGSPLGACLGIAVSSTLEAVLALGVLRRMGFSPALERVRDVVWLILASVGSSWVSALLGVLSLKLSGALGPQAFEKAALVWWAGDALGMLVVVPAALLMWQRRPLERKGEALLLGACILLLCWEVFHGGFLNPRIARAEPSLFVPLCLWASLRFGPRGTAFATLLITVMSIWGSVTGRSPFADGAEGSHLLVDQLFITVHSIAGLSLAAVSAERSNALARLELMAAALRDVSEGVAISQVTPQGPRIVYANEAYRALVGAPRADVVGASPSTHVGQMEPGARQRVETALSEALPFRGDVSLARQDGKRLYSELQLSPVRDEAGEPTHLVSTHRDVTATHEMRARLLATERIAAVGTLAAGVGHEINNPLAYLTMNLDAAAKELSRSGTASRAVSASVRNAQEGAERIRLLVQDLQTFSREGSEERRPVELLAVVAPALRMTRHVLGSRARLVEEYGSVPRVMGSEARLGQVLLNLLVNAMQSIPDGNAGQHEVRVRTGKAPDGRALVEVSDTGQGIHPQVLPHIFEPFFTTKPSGEGTGLGLSICHQIIRAHEGELLVRSEPGQGSVFTVLLPAAPWEAVDTVPQRMSKAMEAQDASKARRGRILIIDDEPRMAQSMRLLLEPSHDVVTTTRGSEALEWVSAGQRFDVVVCDLQMPETTGMDIHAWLTLREPELAERLVFISGGACTATAREFLRTVRNQVLEKPVRPEVLLATIDAALEPGVMRTGS
ncbi:MASE1 domain-containing protein [Stigmatella sp. ncwal1]|uniref:histidine kinase n=1 Tax=Stigmatella ashevillensis TaxID=2995309 RepID=A0ABT5DGL2_9BACT|nr:MASE1 domain-containing protein [Stigmatella ashevillena]MDC0712811.1 MASE1 domain-containing protein [Stigmatella ashevillena]